MSHAVSLSSAAEHVIGRPVWRAWRGAGSHVFLECGDPTISVGDRVLERRLGRVMVRSRSASVWGTHSIGIEMAAWSLLAGESAIADSESPDEVFEQVLVWLRGQHLVELISRGPTTVALRFDLGARFELTCPGDLDKSHTLLSIKHDERVTLLLADGTVNEGPWSS